MYLDRLTSIIETGSTTEKIHFFSYLCDVFESYNKNILDLEGILESIIDYVVTSHDDDAKSEAIEAVCTAQVYQNTMSVDFDKIETELKRSQPSLYTDRYINILSYTHNKKYLDTILQFKDHEDKYVKKAVEEALIEMGA